MDCFGAKKKSYSNQCEKDLRGLAEKVRLLQGEIKAILCEREKENRAYERDMMVFAFKEGEWKQERKKLKEEVKRLKKMLEEKEEMIRGMEDGSFVGEKDEKNWLFSLSGNTAATVTASSFLVEQMREERVWRDEAVDKWKKLYLAIKTELDDLIQRTHRDGLYWKAEEEEMIEELKMEVKAKDETIEELKARLALVEHEEYKRAREVDILRQSLRIMSSKNSPSYPPSKPKLAVLVKQARKA
ncbi:E3 ubiquitin-protein ligase BRE1A isoform X2 [Ricinus communis]|uniref:E3 ubiquitin-protein ligase BRE1A isoform X2 n=1 Tax=Ricinus communis TaxID=3988 RepID=UPI000772CB2E|nr:E3 ubiquitin-protein ligase BRE1A isoform X2 [Ricinus communis]|eukprot:XP_015574053.1 E3 ubiquitin-protein ligase BRE1A isoform X2 [Ricinus communis]